MLVKSPASPLRLISKTPLVLLAFAAAACGTPVVPPPEDVLVDAASDTAADAADASEVKAGTLKWTQASTGSTSKIRAVASIPGKVGQYAAVGDNAKVWLYDGSQLNEIPPTIVPGAMLRSVWVGADGTIFAAGTAGALITYDGKIWSATGETPPDAQFTGISGFGKEVWAVGEKHAAWKGDGSTWLPGQVSTTVSIDAAEITKESDFTCVYVAAADDIWIGATPGVNSVGVVLHGKPGAWKAYPTPVVPVGLYASGTTAMVVGGTVGDYVAKLDGDKFVKQDVAWAQGFLSVNGLDGNAIWATAAKGQMRKYDGKSWSPEYIASPPGTKPDDAIDVGGLNLVGVAVQSADERAVVSPFYLYRWGRQP